MFKLDNTYSKNDIYQILNVPLEKQKGAWDTGYREYEGNIYIFANIGIPGRTGSDYDNYWDGDLFYWEAKTNSNINQPLIQKMITVNPIYSINLFTRTDNSHPFTYEGNVQAKSYSDTTPVKIVWAFRADFIPSHSTTKNSKELIELYEGGKYQVSLNKYERNPLARRMCIDHYGYSCQICEFNFYSKYGDLGKNLIHVHHIVPMSAIRENYTVNPIEDLIPVCPNCHAVIHRKETPISVEEMKKLLHG